MKKWVTAWAQAHADISGGQVLADAVYEALWKND